ncbi:MAG: hypothetical protein JWP60_4501 [Ramlibacter sp.]|nr:hypothetical protein [Ramlibacter sp.]
MMHAESRKPVPRPLIGLLALYAVASLWHFSHNAEYIALYPHMPAWLTREKVYVAWLAVSAVGLAGAGMWVLGWGRAAGVALAFYGLLGLGGLAHYTLALCSEHTLTMNFTIGFEALAGLALAASVAWHFARRLTGNNEAQAHE